MTKSTVFKYNKTQAVRLPKSVAFPESVKEVRIIQQGNARLIVPISSWEDFVAKPGIGDDFERPPQPPHQTRKS